MIKDREQKARVLRLAVANRWLPQLEVDVEPNRSVNAKAPLVTDLDVIAEIPDMLTGYRSLVFDCKTKTGQSAVNRALWLSGLIQKINGSHGFCILKKTKIELDHRLFADELGITLLTEDDFERYAHCTTPEYADVYGNVSRIEVWEQYFSEFGKFPKIAPASSFLRSGYWMSDSASDACRKTLSVLRRAHPELNPDKQSHVALFFDFAALFSRALALITNQIFKAYLRPDSEADLSDALLTMLYGGRESYNHRNELYQIVKSRNLESETTKLSLPEWDSFLKLFRQLLDAPVDLQHTPLILKEASLSFLVGGADQDFLRTLCAERPQAARFSVLITDYLAKATKLPTDFIRITDDFLMPVQPVA